MKRSDRDEEVSPVIKEPRLDIEELRTSSSSATELLQECVEDDKDQSSSVKKAFGVFRWILRSAECGVRSAECGRCGVWKMRSVENAECRKCGVWKMRLALY